MGSMGVGIVYGWRDMRCVAENVRYTHRQPTPRDGPGEYYWGGKD